MPVIKNLSSFGVFQRVKVRYDGDFPRALCPFILYDAVVLKNGKENKRDF
jgi:hypothetical protein